LYFWCNMKHSLLLSLATFVIILGFGLSVFGADEVSRIELKNGIDVLAFEDHSSPLASFWVFYHVGIKNEEYGLNGITRLCGLLIDEGTPGYSKGERSRIIQGLGGTQMWFTELDICGFSSQVPSQALDTVLMLEADRMQNLNFSFEKMMLAKEAIRKERLLRVENSIYGHINEEFFNLAYRAHPYANPVYGWPGTIDVITLDDIKDYYRTFFQPSNATLVAVGDFQKDTLSEKIKQYFEDIVSSPTPIKRKLTEPDQVGERRAILAGDAGIPAFILGYHIPPVMHEDVPILRIINLILVDGESSRLHQRLVEEEKAALYVGGGLAQTEGPQMFWVYAIMNYDVANSVGENMMEEELKRLREEYVSDFELEKAKNRTELNYYRSVQSLLERARLIGQNHMVTGDWKNMKKLVPESREVTKEDIRRIANKYFKLANRVVVYLNPNRGRDYEEQLAE